MTEEVFATGDWVIDHRGGNHRKRSGGQKAESGGTAIALGALMGGIPESTAIGITLLSGSVIAAIQAFAAGAILAMLADTMMPEAFEHGQEDDDATVLGFASAFFLSTL